MGLLQFYTNFAAIKIQLLAINVNGRRQSRRCCWGKLRVSLVAKYERARQSPTEYSNVHSHTVTHTHTHSLIYSSASVGDKFVFISVRQTQTQ